MSATLAVLISGRGSNMQSIARACKNGEIDAKLGLVISDQVNAAGLTWAKNQNIPTAVVSKTDHPDREALDAATAAAIHAHSCTHILLAGYMRVLSEQFVTQFMGRALNIHPSLLPKYKGLNTHARALAAGDRICGATVHFVSPALDSGPAVLQSKIKIEPCDNADTLADKVLLFEHRLYPIATQWMVSGRLTLENGVALLDGQPIEAPIQLGS